MKTEMFKKRMLNAITKLLKSHKVPVERAKDIARVTIDVCEANPSSVPTAALAKVRERYPEIRV